MPITTNDTFQSLIAYLKQPGAEIGRSPEQTPEYRRFIERFPADRLVTLTLDEYCVGKGQESFCWWIERGLQPALGRYSPGSSKGHILFFEKNGAVYKHRHLANLTDEEALRYTLKVQSVIANADVGQDLRWIDDDSEIYRRADVEPLVTVGVGRKLRLLSCYHPAAILPIQSSEHIEHFLLKLGCPAGEIPAYWQAVARSQVLFAYFAAARNLVPRLTPRDFMVALYHSPLNLAPEKKAENGDNIDTPLNGQSKQAPVETKSPLNSILYGPPGTGKTYETIGAALQIADPQFLADHPPSPAAEWDDVKAHRTELKTRFDELIKAGRIRFVTFHQSFSYEDFVEGLRAQTNDNGQIEYRVEDGVFKQLCDQARTEATRQGQPEIAANPRIWKISIDGTTPNSPSRTYCLDYDEARIGWGETGDLRNIDWDDLANVKLGEPERTYVSQRGSNDRNTLQTFCNDIAEGDILICIRSNSEIDAVGVVTGKYRFEQVPSAPLHADYKHVLPVRWLYRDLHLSVLPLNENVLFTQKTVYALDRFGWGDLLAYLQSSGATPIHGESRSPMQREPYVLIIDEINRGNVSRIFGELITLIEPSKRDGRPEALSVQLPYSKRPFSVPANVYLVGTMNTADRSLSGIDIALRRRFSFREMLPQPELLAGLEIEGLDIGRLLSTLNDRIEVLLDRDHCLGHAYFLPLYDNPSLAELKRIIKFEILPLLQEYFFEDLQRIQWVLNDHRKPRDLAFVLEEPGSLDLLFGSNLSIGAKGSRWIINESAFDRIDAYRQILTSPKASAT